MNDNGRAVLKVFLLEVAIYAVLVVAYFYAVLTLLSAWLSRLYFTKRDAYALIAVALIIGQGILLEMVTSFLLRTIISRRQ